MSLIQVNHHINHGRCLSLMTLHEYAETRYSSRFFYFNELKQGGDA